MQHPLSLLKVLWFLLSKPSLHRIGCRPPSEPCCPAASSEGYVKVNSSLMDSLVYNMLSEWADPASWSSLLWVTLPLGVPGQGSYSSGEFGEDWFSHLCGAQRVIVMIVWWPDSHCPSCFLALILKAQVILVCFLLPYFDFLCRWEIWRVLSHFHSHVGWVFPLRSKYPIICPF